jgi:hypothetical protein
VKVPKIKAPVAVAVPQVRLRRPSWRYSLRALGEILGIALVLVAVVIGLVQLGFHAPPPGPTSQEEYGGDGGAILRWDVRRIRIPETLAELAREQLHSRVIRDHEGIRRYLEQRNQKGLWYAINLEGERSGGSRSAATYIRHPYDEPYRFPELLEILARATGKSSDVSHSNFSGASVDIFSDELMNEEPAKPSTEIAPPPGTDRRGVTTE